MNHHPRPPSASVRVPSRIPVPPGAGLGSLLLLLSVHCNWGGYTKPAMPAPAIASFTAAKSPITSGASTTLTADFAYGLGEIDQGVGPVADDLPVTVKPSATTTYTLTDSGAGGAPATRQVTVEVVPVPAAPVINPPAVVEPGLTGLTASVAEQAGCSYAWEINKGGGTITAGAAGPVVTFDTAPSGELTLACTVTNAAGTAVRSELTFQLGGPTIDSFTADPELVTAGDPVTLAFSFSGSGSISSPGGPDLPVSPSGSSSITVTPSSTTTYTLTVTNSKGQAAQPMEVTVRVVPPPSITSFSASPAIIGPGTAAHLEASFAAGDGGSASVDNGVGDLVSDEAKDSPALDQTTGFELTVINAAGRKVTATTRVLVGSLAVFAGTPSGEGSKDGPVADARYRGPAGLAVAGDGSLMLADTLNDTIRVLSADGQVATLAGLEGHPGSADGQGGEARFDGPVGLAFNPETGYLYVTDSGNDAVRVVTPDGTVSTLAGSPGHPGSTDAVGAGASFRHPTGIVFGDFGDGPVLFVADTGNDTIREIQAETGEVTTLTGVAGLAGNRDGLPGTAGEPGAALLSAPAGLAWIGNASGRIYVADAGNNSIRLVGLDGEVVRVAGDPGGASGSADGLGGAAQFANPQALALDPDSHLLYIADTGNSALRRMAPDFTVTTLAGTPGVTGSVDGGAAQFDHPQGLALAGGGDGDLDVADTGNDTVRRMLLVPEPGPVATYSGAPGSRGSADGQGADAAFRDPRGAVLGPSGSLYLADAANHTIRRITPAGAVDTLAGSAGYPGFSDSAGQGPAGARFNRPTAVAAGVDAQGRDVVIVADTGNHAVRKILADGTVTTLAGTGQPGAVDSADGPPQFNGPAGVALDGSGHVLVSDQANGTLRRIAADGTVTTLAGTAGVTGSSDGPAGPGVSFTAPAGLAVAKDGTTYIADNDTIRRLANGQVDTLAGMAGEAGSVDAAGRAARLDGPFAIALDAAGNLFVTNTGSSTVCMISPGDGSVTTIIGSPAASANDPGPLPALISPPYGIAVDPATSNILITVDDAIMQVDFHK